MVAIRRLDACLLIAEDDDAFRQTVVEIVEPYFRTIAVPSGEQAIQVVESTPVHLALFDLNMHLLSGLDAIRWLRDHHLGFPCILMSADVTDEIELQAHQLKTFSVLRKPVRRAQLLDTIHCALEL
ncbi:response regulator [Planctomicrobium piriforme]|uniref:Response regulator receiver domain-containing protein n=1 Tax=Planctomicrobium piriforme TaxID=1576369 RepID=A0A1I3GUP9_9PLAN|nr:response regulator [Planctomicrobium piriforme]SFI27080.1 Response regulator receiver domain-containing protein [Planctomicrobium piriforme]